MQCHFKRRKTYYCNVQYLTMQPLVTKVEVPKYPMQNIQIPPYVDCDKFEDLTGVAKVHRHSRFRKFRKTLVWSMSIRLSRKIFAFNSSHETTSSNMNTGTEISGTETGAGASTDSNVSGAGHISVPPPSPPPPQQQQLQPFRIRAQIKVVQLICLNKRVFRRLVRNLGGADAVLLYDLLRDLFITLMDNNGRAGRKIINALVKVFSEIFVLFTNQLVTIVDWDCWGSQMEMTMEELCTFIDQNHKDLGVQLNDWVINTSDADSKQIPENQTPRTRYSCVKSSKPEILDQMKQKFILMIQSIHSLTRRTTGQHLGSNSLRQLQKVTNKLCEPGPLQQMCDFHSQASHYAKLVFNVVRRMNEKEARRRELTN